MAGKGKRRLIYLGAALILIPIVYAWAQAVRWEMQKQYVAQRQSQWSSPTQPQGDLPYSIRDLHDGILVPADYHKTMESGLPNEIIERFFWWPMDAVTLEKPILYYEHPSTDSSVVCELPAGTPCHVGHGHYREKLEMWVGYGVITYPTADPNWRYARILDVAPQYSHNDAALSQRMAYVRTEDIKLFWEGCMKKNPGIEQYILWGATANHPEWKDLSDPLLIADSLLYQQGVYASPNLRPMPWNLWCTLSAVLGTVCLMAAWVKGKSDEKKKITPGKS